MCQKESWGAIFATTEAHSIQRDQPPRMHGPGLWMYEQKEQRVTPVRMIRVNCILWCPGWDGKERRGVVAHWWRLVPSVRKVAGLNLTSRHLGTLDKSLTRSCLYRPTWLPCG